MNEWTVRWGPLTRQITQISLVSYVINNPYDHLALRQGKPLPGFLRLSTRKTPIKIPHWKCKAKWCHTMAPPGRSIATLTARILCFTMWESWRWEEIFWYTVIPPGVIDVKSARMITSYFTTIEVCGTNNQISITNTNHPHQFHQLGRNTTM